MTRGRARGTTKAGHLQLLEVTTWRKVTRGGAAEILAAPAPVARQTKVNRGRGPKEQEKEKTGEVPQHDAGGLVGPAENPEQQRGPASVQHIKRTARQHTRVYDLNHKMMAALGNVAVIYNSFDEAGGNLEDESAKRETLYDDENAAMEDLAKALQQWERLQDELRGFQENMDNANVEVNNCQARLNTAVNGLDNAFIELNKSSTFWTRRGVDWKTLTGRPWS